MLSKKLNLNEQLEVHRGEEFQQQVQMLPSDLQPTHASLLLSLTPEIDKIQEDLAKVVVLSLVDGFVNEASVLEVAPTIINMALAGLISPLNDCSFLVPLASREKIKEVCKLDNFKVATKDSPCTLKLAPWSV